MREQCDPLSIRNRFGTVTFLPIVELIPSDRLSGPHRQSPVLLLIMKKRMFFMLLAVFAFLAVIGGFKFFQIKAAIAQGSSYVPPPEAVTTVVATSEDWNVTLNAIGTVNAVQGVMVAADLPGLVSEISFVSGQRVSKGDVLVRLDTKQERAQLTAADAQR